MHRTGLQFTAKKAKKQRSKERGGNGEASLDSFRLPSFVSFETLRLCVFAADLSDRKFAAKTQRRKDLPEGLSIR
jgi:hypothetical protein